MKGEPGIDGPVGRPDLNGTDGNLKMAARESGMKGVC